MSPRGAAWARRPTLFPPRSIRGGCGGLSFETVRVYAFRHIPMAVETLEIMLAEKRLVATLFVMGAP